jgi:hypothetical protein
MKASPGATLNIFSPIDNNKGSITATDGIVNLNTTTINNSGSITAAGGTVNFDNTLTGTFISTIGGVGVGNPIFVTTVANSGGSISTTGQESKIALTGATVTGGNVNITLGGTLEVVASNLGVASNNDKISSSAVVNKGTILVDAGTSLDMSSSTITNSTDATAATTTVSGLISVNGKLILGGTVNNAQGQINALQNAEIDLNGATITKGGTVLINNGGTLDASGKSEIDSAVTNAGHIELQPGTLTLSGTVANTGGTIESLQSGATLDLNGATITAGGKVNIGTGDIIDAVQGVNEIDSTLTNAGTVKVDGGATLAFKGTVTGTGAAVIEALSGGTIDLEGGAKITGGP